MNTRIILYAAGSLLLALSPAEAGSRSGGTGAGAVTIPADTLSSGGGTSTAGSGASATTITTSVGGVIGTVTAASPATTNQQGYIPQILPIPIPLAQALDTSGLTWTTGGSIPWFGQVTTTHDGIDAARSGFMTDGQESWIETTVTGPGTLSFWWKVSSSGEPDRLDFRLDGFISSQISGNVDWGQQSVAVPGGSHTLRWTYRMGEFVSGGPHAAWVDQVVFGPAAGFDLWASQNIPAGRDATFTGDWNGDGVSNAVAYVFGNTRIEPVGGQAVGTGKIPAPPAIPADVNVYLELSGQSLSVWEQIVRWENGNAPVFKYPNFTSITGGYVVDTGNGRPFFYRYRITRR